MVSNPERRLFRSSLRFPHPTSCLHVPFAWTICKRDKAQGAYGSIAMWYDEEFIEIKHDVFIPRYVSIVIVDGAPCQYRDKRWRCNEDHELKDLAFRQHLQVSRCWGPSGLPIRAHAWQAIRWKTGVEGGGKDGWTYPSVPLWCFSA